MILMSGCDMPLCEIAQEQGSEGVEEIRLFYGDTESWVPSMNPNYQHLRRGRFFHYHPNDDTVYTKFVMESGPDYGTIISGHIDESVEDSFFFTCRSKAIRQCIWSTSNIALSFRQQFNIFGKA